MDFETKDVNADDKSFNRIELSIEDNDVTGETRLFCENGTIEELNNKESSLYKKISSELDNLEELKHDAIRSVSESYFDRWAIREAIEDDDAEMLELLRRLDIDIKELSDEKIEIDLLAKAEANCLREIQANTKCREIYWNQKNYVDEDFDFSGRLLVITDPLNRTWLVGNDYIEPGGRWDPSDC